jgi:GT2 family glycosyltransferase
MYEVVKLLNENLELDLIYSDEDKIDENGKHSMPHFKPQWCPDSFLSRNYIGHVVACRTSILKKIGGFRVGFEGSQDYDMLLRFTEQTQRIARIPKILYHWRIHAASTASVEDVKPYAYEAARKALTEACARRDEEAEIRFLSILRGYYAPRYKLKKEAKISIIIPTKDQADILETCIKSIFEVSTWKNFEVIVISNNSTEKSLFKLLNNYKQQYPEQFLWTEYNIPFNFSKLMNEGVKHASGDYYLLLNNDMEVISPDWMEAMLEQAQRKTIGAVGVKLLYYNGTIQHAGVVIGLGGVAGHAFVGQDKDEPGYFNYLQCINNFSAVTAACLMVAKEKYHQIGGFDEQFEIEFNDVDFCLRLREAGYHNIYLPHVELYHYESFTRGHPHLSKESYERHVRELTLFKNRWQSYVDDDPCYSPNLTRGAHDFSLAL